MERNIPILWIQRQAPGEGGVDSRPAALVREPHRRAKRGLGFSKIVIAKILSVRNSGANNRCMFSVAEGSS